MFLKKRTFKYSSLEKIPVCVLLHKTHFFFNSPSISHHMDHLTLISHIKKTKKKSFNRHSRFLETEFAFFFFSCKNSAYYLLFFCKRMENFSKCFRSMPVATEKKRIFLFLITYMKNFIICKKKKSKCSFFKLKIFFFCTTYFNMRFQ